MDKQWLSDEKQLDTKEHDHLGSRRHEPLVFDMRYNPHPQEDDHATFTRLIGKLHGKAPGSFMASTRQGKTWKVTLISDTTILCEVRSGGKLEQSFMKILRSTGEWVREVPL